MYMLETRLYRYRTQVAPQLNGAGSTQESLQHGR